MFNLLFKGLGLTIVLIALFSYGTYLKTGKWFGPTPDNLTMPDIHLPEVKTPNIQFSKTPLNKNTEVYKWQDENGVWHYQTEKPEHTQAEQISE